MKKSPPLETTCATCGKGIALTGDARSKAIRRGWGYCSSECGKVSPAVKDGHAKQAAAMKGFKHNPEARAKLSASKMGNHYNVGRKASPETRAKMSAAKIGHEVSAAARAKIAAAGGKGGVPTKMEERLLNYLPTCWLLHYRVPGLNGAIDIAYPERKIAVEVDGRGRTLKQQAYDAKKTAWLAARGWIVLRVTNKAVAEKVVLQSEIVKMLAGVRT